MFLKKLVINRNFVNDCSKNCNHVIFLLRAWATPQKTSALITQISYRTRNENKDRQSEEDFHFRDCVLITRQMTLTTPSVHLLYTHLNSETKKQILKLNWAVITIILNVHACIFFVTILRFKARFVFAAGRQFSSHRNSMTLLLLFLCGHLCSDVRCFLYVLSHIDLTR